MKHISLFLVLAVFVGFAVPQSASALSCLDPASSLEYYMDEAQNTIFTAVAGETVEHVTQKASTDGDPNRQYNAGYVGQYVQVSDVHKGNIKSEQWVYYSVNATWGYMCTSQPPEVGTTNVYVVQAGTGNFDLPTVVQVFPTDSDLAKTLINDLEEAEVNTFLQEVTAESWKQDLGRTLREMISMIRIRLAEFRFWASQ